MKRNWKTYLGWIALAEGVGALAGWLTREGTQFYKEFVTKPELAPPAIVFPVVWGILYGLMGFGAARVSLTPESAERSRGLNLVMVQLAATFLWSIFCFNCAITIVHPGHMIHTRRTVLSASVRRL